MWTTNVFLYKFDISQGYHHIDIDDNYQKYLGFSWKIDSRLSTLCSLFYPSVLFLLHLFLPRFCLVL